MLHALIALLMLISTNAGAWLGGTLLPARWRVPLDGGAVLCDRQRWLGQHKTWAGLITGLLSCGAVALCVRRPFLLGVAFGALSLAGDCASSFVKRRLRCRPGAELPLLDQLPEALAPLLVLARPLGLSWLESLAIAAIFMLLDLALVRARHSRPPDELPDR
jgi:CDP-2,3-bis-(O-geranylgeranyl)-sn-glycerol synthase